MSKGQKDFNFKKTIFYFSLSSLLFLLYFSNFYLSFFEVISRYSLLLLLLLPLWTFDIFIISRSRVRGHKLKSEEKEKILIYSLFITFLVFYFTSFSSMPLIIAQTPTQCIYCNSMTWGGCYVKMKDANCNDIDWYDFYRYTTASRACAIKVSHDLHYTYTQTLYDEHEFCPTTEAMWKAITCDAGWPSESFSDGEVCKVWWREGLTIHNREGKWDPDSNTCIIKCNNKRESTASDARDKCGSSEAGDGKCEQACGADPCCDESSGGEYILTNDCKGYCWDNCSFTPWSVSITASRYTLVLGSGSVEINATANLNLPSGYSIKIYEDGNEITSCSSSPCRTSVIKNTAGTRVYYAKIVAGSTDVTASTSITINWIECNSDNNCPSGSKCYCGYCSTSWVNHMCGSTSCCNKEYEYTDSGKGVCRGMGYSFVRNNISYICAPTPRE